MIACQRILIATIVAASLGFPSAAKTPLGQITQIVGSALVRHDGDTSWGKARMRMPIYDGDAVATTAESFCEITATGDRMVRFGEKTTAIVSDKAGSQAKVKVAQGSVWINVKHLVNNRALEVATPTAVAAIRGTVFEIECGENSSNYLVFKGCVAVSSSAGKRDSTFLVNAGEQFTFVKDMARYLKEQETAMRRYIEESGEELDRFNKEEQEQFDRFEKEVQEQLDRMLAEERTAFRRQGDLNYALRTIDASKTAKSKWIVWNKERDRDLGW
jgi:hypothetical protein